MERQEYTLDCSTWDWDGGKLQGAHVMLTGSTTRSLPPLTSDRNIGVKLCPGYEHCWHDRDFMVPESSLVPYPPITAEEIASVSDSLAGILEELRG